MAKILSAFVVVLCLAAAVVGGFTATANGDVLLCPDCASSLGGQSLKKQIIYVGLRYQECDYGGGVGYSESCPTLSEMLE